MRLARFRPSFPAVFSQIVFAALVIGFTHSVAGAAPDLVPISISVAQTGSWNITISDTVKNAGDVDATSFRIDYYLAKPTTKDWYGNWLTPASGGTLVCARTVSGLTAGASSGPVTTTCAHNLPVPTVNTNPGYYVYAVVDAGAAVSETNEGNNTLVSARFAVVIGPDLTSTALSASPAGTTDVTITHTVKNAGNTDAGGFRIDYYLAKPTTKDWYGNWLTPASGGTLLCAQPVDGLAAGASLTVGPLTCAHNLPVPTVNTNPGYYMYVVVDAGAAVGETNEGNNTLVSARFAVVIGPDLVPTAVNAALVGVTDVTITTTVTNAGNTDAGAFEVDYYIAEGVWVTQFGESSYWKVLTTPTSGGTWICQQGVASLAAGASATLAPVTCAHNLPVPTNGTYYVYAVVDSSAMVSEVNESNNALASNTFSVVIGPDLVPTALTVTGSGKLAISDRIQNQGNIDAGAFDVGYYLSANSVYQAGTDTPLVARDGTPCRRSVAGLTTGASDPVTGETTTEPCFVGPDTTPGYYYVIAVADSGSSVGETNEANNTAVSNRLKIGPGIKIESCTPNSGAIGTVITVLGTGFGNEQGSSIVDFNGVAATTYPLWDPSGTEIHVEVPIGATSGPVRVLADGRSNSCDFTVVTPQPTPPADYDIVAVSVKGEVEDEDDERLTVVFSVLNVNAPADPGFSYEVVGRKNGVVLFSVPGLGNDPLDGVSTTVSVSDFPRRYLDDGECLEFSVSLTDEDPDVDNVRASVDEEDDHDEARKCKARTKFKFESPQHAEDSDKTNAGTFAIGTTVTVAFSLTDKTNGAPISNADAFLWVSKVSDHALPDVPATPDPTAVPDTGNRFRFDPASNRYLFNWSTTGLTKGTWRLRVDLGDGKPHHINVKLAD